jgi:hypothetical protein
MEGNMKRTLSIFSITVLAVVMIAGAVGAGTQQTSATDAESVKRFSDGSDTGGQSTLTRTEDMVHVTVEAARLRAGNAYTLWWVVFNDPSACSAPGCGEDDIFNEDGSLNEAGIRAAGIAVGHATGNLARADRTTEFGGRLIRNDASGGHQIVIPAGLGAENVLMTASGLDVEVHPVVQNHGKARRGKRLLRQLTRFQAGCNPKCKDVQFAVHQP